MGFFLLFTIAAAIYLTYRLLVNGGPKPFKITYGYFSLIITNWLLFLTGAYSLFSAETGSILWDVMWSILVISGIFVSINEYRNNRSLALLVLCITALHFYFFLFSLFLGSM